MNEFSEELGKVWGPEQEQELHYFFHYDPRGEKDCCGCNLMISGRRYEVRLCSMK